MTLYQNHSPFMRNDLEIDTIRGFRFLVGLSFGYWVQVGANWVQPCAKLGKLGA